MFAFRSVFDLAVAAKPTFAPDEKLAADERKELRTRAYVAITNSVLFLCCVNEYPYHPGRIIRTFAATVLVGTVLLATHVLHRLSDQAMAAAKADGDNSAKLDSRSQLVPDLLFAGIPLLIALNAYFPDLAYELQEWLSLRGALPDIR
jgi:hypothetical protein